ncbi:MAG TPA: hypothetical protein VHT73_19320 [Thermodesulfobacteriota bacterium]|nr:hypothetical protein [Thermodesulfobacteriota bacterium]
MVLKVIFKKTCPICGVTHRKVAFEGTKEQFDIIDEIDIPPFQCCNLLDADSYELMIDERIARKGQIEDMFDIVEE